MLSYIYPLIFYNIKYEMSFPKKAFL